MIFSFISLCFYKVFNIKTQMNKQIQQLLADIQDFEIVSVICNC